jgi:hypothetical protein
VLRRIVFLASLQCLVNSRRRNEYFTGCVGVDVLWMVRVVYGFTAFCYFIGLIVVSQKKEPMRVDSETPL